MKQGAHADYRRMTQLEWRQYLGILLANERVRGDIIFLSIGMESRLDSFLTGYFAYEAKQRDFEVLVLARLTLSQKIDVLKNLDFRPALKSFPEVVKIYAGVNRLRNHAAHASWADGEKVFKLADNEFVRGFMEKYPASVDQTRGRVLRLLAALKRSRDYRQNEFDPDEDIPF